MTVELVPMPESRLCGWIEESFRVYVEDRMAAGETRDDAQANADRFRLSVFPDDRPAHPHAVFDVVAEGKPVGFLWVGPRPGTSDAGAWWVFNVEIDAPHRRLGYGRAAMQLAEAEVRRRGGTELGLNVFGFNTSARSLYESLGYETTSVQMRKGLAG